ncbi:MAG TPA: RNA-binding protein, partial [Oligoflexia bacterium]|nr:RNA-binding protein [Oligoflexia bacterium]
MGKKLFVGNLPFSATDESLAQIFAQVGTVESAKVITDKMSGRSKGFGFVEMADDAQAADAVARFNGIELEGRPLTVAEAKPQEPRQDRGGRGG